MDSMIFLSAVVVDQNIEYLLDDESMVCLHAVILTNYLTCVRASASKFSRGEFKIGEHQQALANAERFGARQSWTRLCSRSFNSYKGTYNVRELRRAFCILNPPQLVTHFVYRHHWEWARTHSFILIYSTEYCLNPCVFCVCSVHL